MRCRITVHRGPPRYTLRWAWTTSSVSSPMAPPATQRPFSRMRNSLATRRAKGSFCSTSSTVTPASSIELQDDVADFVHDVGLNPFRGLVQNQQRRFEHERAADRELLLLPAGEIAAAPVEHLSSTPGTGRRSDPESCGDRSCARPGRRAGSPPRSIARRCRVPAARSRSPGARGSRRAASRRSVPANDISPAVAGSSPMMHLSSVVLPMPLRPIRQVRDPFGTARSTSQSVWLPP